MLERDSIWGESSKTAPIITCAMLAGVYKVGLSPDEREEFRSMLSAEAKPLPAEKAEIIEDANSLLFCFPLAGNAVGIDPSRTGGACIVAYGTGATGQQGLPEDRFSNFSGSWSAAIVDESAGIWLGRDSKGAHIMFYAPLNGALYIASSLTLFHGFPFEIDQDAVADFLHFLYIPAPRTIYRDVKAVLPGEIIFFDGETIKCRKVNYRGPEPFSGVGTGEKDWLLEYEGLLIESVKSCCPEKGKSALFLSGGKDSSTLAVAACLSGLENIEAVTLAFEERAIDESSDARIVANHLQMPFRALKFSPDTYLKHWSEFIRHLGQPLGDCAAFPIFVCMKELGDEFDVYLDGTGNDGYLGITTTWQEDVAWHLYRLFPWLYHVPFGAVKQGVFYSIDILLRTFIRPREEQFVSWNGWTGEELARLTGRRPDWYGIPLYSMYRECDSPISFKTATLCGIWEPEAAYRKVVQMAATLRKSVRYPFLNRDLVHYSEQLPTAWKYEKRINKVIVRRLLQKHLPPEIVGKRKGYFLFPKEYILDSNAQDIAGRMLSSEIIRKHGFVDEAIVGSCLEKFRRGERLLEDRIWSLVLLHAWAEERHC